MTRKQICMPVSPSVYLFAIYCQSSIDYKNDSVSGGSHCVTKVRNCSRGTSAFIITTIKEETFARDKMCDFVIASHRTTNLHNLLYVPSSQSVIAVTEIA